MKAIKILAIAALAGIIFTGCCKGCRAAKHAAVESLQGTVWRLSQLDGQTIDEENKYEITFMKNGRVAGIGACNRFFGPYEILNTNGGIKIGPLASTMMACLPENVENKYFRMMEDVHLYQLDKGKLYLFVDNKVKAIFTATDKPVTEEGDSKE